MTANPLDPVLDSQLVLSLARQHLPTAESVTAVDESGGEARAYVIDQDFIFKTQRPHKVRPRTSLEKEVFHLRQLAAVAPDINVPRILGYGREDSVEYTLMTRVAGVPALQLRLEGEARSQLLRDLGGTLRRMHSLPVTPFRESGLFPEDAGAAEVRRRLAVDLREGVKSAAALGDEWDLEIPPEAVASKMLDAVVRIDEQPVPVHWNPGPEHVFVDPDSLRWSGLIDFGDAYISHPAFDLRGWTAAADRQALIAGYAAAGPLGDAFCPVWRAAMVARLMTGQAWRRHGRAQALNDLRSILAES
jgi:hygromycin-B 7''-O-kinase